MSQAIFLYIQFNIKDAAAFARYSEQVGTSVQTYGGRTVAVSRQPQWLAGSANAQISLIQSWPSLASAQAWLASPEYAPLKTLRDEQAMVDLNIVVVPQLH